MTEDGNILNDQELRSQKSLVKEKWTEITHNPDHLTDLSKQKVLFAAGGGLVTRFGVEESGIWQSMMEAAQNGRISVAGIDFSLDQLSEMGDFYRWMHDQGYSMHCIDERLEGDEDHLMDEVHCLCGACAAVGHAANLSDVEDLLLNELEQRVKQQVYEDMPNHVSMAILVDYRGADVVLGEKRRELKSSKALPFNVSMPLDKLLAWHNEVGGDATSVVRTMALWNVQIARNIIGDNHNELHQLASQTIIVADRRNVGDNMLLTTAEAAVKNVDHGEYFEIN